MEQVPQPGLPAWVDDIHDSEQMANRMGMSKSKLLVAATGKNPKIVGFWINERVVKFHPRLVLAKLAEGQGVSMELIASVYGIKNHE